MLKKNILYFAATICFSFVFFSCTDSDVESDNLSSSSFDITQDLFAYYELNGNGDDSSGNSRNLSPIGTPSPTVDRFNTPGNASAFTSANNNFSGTSITPSGDISISAWINMSSITSGVLSGWGNGTSPGTRRLTYSTGTGIVFEVVNEASGITNVAIGTDLFINNWQHVVGVLDPGSNQILLYFNGTLANASNASGAYTSSLNSYGIGCADTCAANSANALMDDVRVYSRALSASDVKALYDLELVAP